MAGFILPIIIGIVCIIIGITNTKGNLSALHSYHRERVKPEDVIPFGRLVGAGMIVIGSSLILNGSLSIISEIIKKPVFMWIGTAIMVAGIAVGTVIAFYAMKKYNKGIF